MAESTSDLDEAVCRYCGAPANPAFAHNVSLYANSREHLDGQGFPVERGRGIDYVHVKIPRCAACCDRQILAPWLIMGGAVVGLVFGSELGSVVGLNPLMSVVGAVIGLVTVGYGRVRCERLSRRRSTPYPPVERLHQAGWRDDARWED